MGQFNLYNQANSIDAVNDLLLIYNKASGTLETINRNTFESLASQPLGLTDTQSPTNKTLGITNTIIVLDTLFTIQDNGDNTKQVQFQASGLTTGTTRTLTVPNISSTIATIGGSQTFTGVNSFTGSSWTGGAISNTAIATDTITGFTTSNSGTIYGVGIVSGVITGASTVGPAALATNAVQANQLATTAISLGYAQIITTFNTASTSATQVTGLTSTVTIPAGGRKVKITVFCPVVTVTASPKQSVISIWDGTVGSGTQLNASTLITSTTSVGSFMICIAVVTPAAGSKTYNVGLTADTSTTSNIVATAIAPAFILVETI